MPQKILQKAKHFFRTVNFATVTCGGRIYAKRGCFQALVLTGNQIIGRSLPFTPRETASNKFSGDKLFPTNFTCRYEPETLNLSKDWTACPDAALNAAVLWI